MLKAIRKGISHETKCRSDKKLGKVFVVLGRRKDVASVGGKHYPMIDDFTRRAWIITLQIYQTLAVLSEVSLRMCVLIGSRCWLRFLDMTMEGSFSGGSEHLCAMSF